MFDEIGNSEEGTHIESGFTAKRSGYTIVSNTPTRGNCTKNTYKRFRRFNGL